MSTKIITTSIEYFSQLKNGDTFSLNPSDTANHLLGNLMAKMQLKTTVQISTTFLLGRYEVTGGNTIILSNGQSFLDQDFYAGGQANLVFINAGNYSFDINTISSDGTIMVVSNVNEIDNAGAVIGPSSLPNGSYGTGTDNDVMRDLSPSEGLICKFNFLGNNAVDTYISSIDQVEQAYKFAEVRSSAPSTVTGEWNNEIKGSDTGGMTAEFLGDIVDNGVNKGSGDGGAGSCPLPSIQEFEIVQDFIINPYYLQGEFDNVDTSIAPERLANDSLRHILEFEFRQNLSNPNTSKFGTYNGVLGNTNYFGGTYIDEPQQYSISDLVITDVDTGLSVKDIDYTHTTRFNFNVNSDSGTFTTAQPVVAYHSYLPNSSEYRNQTDVYQDVWIYDSVRNEVDAVAASGGVITDFEATLTSANQIAVQYNVVYTVDQQLRLQNGRRWMTSIEVGDDTLTTVISDKTNLVVEAAQYNANTDVAGLVTFDQVADGSELGFYTHPMTYPSTGFSSLNAWKQDAILYNWAFSLDLDEGAFLERLDVRLVAFNTVDLTYFNLDVVEYDLSGQVITDGPPQVQNIEIDTTRGFPLAAGSPFNLVQMETDTYSAPNQRYTGRTAFRVNFQEWLELPNADTVFYDPSEPNNGLNQDASRYSLQNNYEIRILLDLDVSNGEVTTNYINSSATCNIYEYNEQDGSPVTWNCIEETFDTNMNNTNGVILKNENTILRATYVPTPAFTIDPGLYWGVVRLHEFNVQGNTVYELSTFRDSVDNNPLISPNGTGFAKLDAVSGNIELCAEVDYTRLDPNKDYVVTWRMGLDDQSPPVVPAVKIQIDGNTRQVNGDFISFQQTEIMANSVLVDQLFSLSENAGGVLGWKFRFDDNIPAIAWDPYSKSDWYANTIEEPDFNSLAIKLANNSGGWVYAEATDSSLIDEGLIIEFDRPSMSQSTSNLVFTIGAEDIDLDRTIYFDRKITLNSITPSGLAPQTQLYVEVVTGGPSTVDWTTMEQLTGNNITTDLPTIQGLIDAIPDGDKYALRFLQQNSNDLTQTVTINFDYDSAQLAEKPQSIAQMDINTEYRPFGQAAFFGPWPNSDNIYTNTDPTDAGLLSLLDTSTSNPYTIVFWGKPNNNVGISSDRDAIFGPNNPTSGNGAGISFTLSRLNNQYEIVLRGSNAGRKVFQWQPRYSTNRIGMFVVSNDGTQTINGIKCYYNGLQMKSNERVILEDVAISGTGQPSNGRYYHGLYISRTNGRSNVGTSERIQIFDKELTSAEVRNLFNDPEAGRTGRISNLFRDWDFANFAGGLIPENVANQDMTIVTGGSQPTSVSFY